MGRLGLWLGFFCLVRGAASSGMPVGSFFYSTVSQLPLSRVVPLYRTASEIQYCTCSAYGKHHESVPCPHAHIVMRVLVLIVVKFTITHDFVQPSTPWYTPINQAHQTRHLSLSGTTHVDGARTELWCVEKTKYTRSRSEEKLQSTTHTMRCCNNRTACIEND